MKRAFFGRGRFAKFLCMGALSGLCFGLGTHNAVAFEVKPAITEIRAEAGSTVERALEITNTQTTPQTLFFTVQKFRSGSGGTPIFLDPADTSGLPEWFRLSAKEVVIPPKTTLSIRVQLQVPTEAASGGHYAAVFVSEKPRTGGEVSIGTRIATLWLLTVEQKASDASVAPRWHWDELVMHHEYSGWPITRAFSTKMKNVGNTHGIATIRIKARSLLTGRVEEQYQTVRLLPGEERGVELTWNGGGLMGIWRVEAMGVVGERAEYQQVRLFISWELMVATGAMLGVLLYAMIRVWRIRRPRGILGA